MIELFGCPSEVLFFIEVIWKKKMSERKLIEKKDKQIKNG